MTQPVNPVAAPGAAPVADAKMKAASREFEAVFLGQISRLMLEGVDTGEFGGGHGEEMFRGVLADRIGTEMARRGGIGLSQPVLEQMIRMQQENGDG